MPDQVSGDMDRLKRMIAYFRSLPELSDDIIIEEDILRFVVKEDLANIKQFFVNELS